MREKSWSTPAFPASRTRTEMLGSSESLWVDKSAFCALLKVKSEPDLPSSKSASGRPSADENHVPALVGALGGLPRLLTCLLLLEFIIRDSGTDLGEVADAGNKAGPGCP